MLYCITRVAQFGYGLLLELRRWQLHFFRASEDHIQFRANPEPVHLLAVNCFALLPSERLRAMGVATGTRGTVYFDDYEPDRRYLSLRC